MITISCILVKINFCLLYNPECSVPLSNLTNKINNLYNNKLKYLTKEFTTLSRTIEKELWEIFHYTNQPEPLQLQELKLRNSTLMKELKRAKYLKDITKPEFCFLNTLYFLNIIVLDNFILTINKNSISVSYLKNF